MFVFVDLFFLLMELCIQERVYNPYYMELTDKLCSLERQYSRTLQFVMYEHFNMLNEHPLRKLINLSQFLSAAMGKELFSLSALKVSVKSCNKKKLKNKGCQFYEFISKRVNILPFDVYALTS